MKCPESGVNFDLPDQLVGLNLMVFTVFECGSVLRDSLGNHGVARDVLKAV